MRTRNRVVYFIMGAALIGGGWCLIFWPEQRIEDVGMAIMILGAMGTLFLMVWNLVWINCVLFPITKSEASK
jgi:hypothetical protein